MFALVTLGPVIGPPTSGLLHQPQSGTFITIDFPKAASTGGDPSNWLRINPAGQIVGGYQDTNGMGHGFLLNRGRFITIDVPGAVFTEVNAINPEGDIGLRAPLARL